MNRIIASTLILMSLIAGILITSQNASAFTYTQRFSEGMSQGYIDCNDGKDYHPNSPYLTSHTLAYQNGYNQGSYNCHHGIPKQTKSTIEAQPTETSTTTARCDASVQQCGYNSDGSSYPIHNNNNHVSHVGSTTVNPFPHHCDIGGWPSCYQTGYNAGLADGKAGQGNGNCNGKHSANFCRGYSNGWQDAHRTNIINSTNNRNNNYINSNDQNQTSKQGQLSTNNNINNQTFNPNNFQKFSPIINIINNPSSTSGSASTSNTTSGSGSLSGSNSGSASNAGHNK